MIDNTVLRPSDTNAVLVLSRAKTDRGLFQHLDQALIANRITFRACYCSSLDQCWVGDLASLKTREVAECPAPEHPYRYNYWPHRQ